VGLTRLRITLRTMMAVVAVLAMSLGLFAWMEKRAVRFRALKDHHMVLFRPNHFPVGKVGLSTLEEESRRDQAWYHFEMAKRYRAAALRPWLTVAPDPPEP
jgi:hypothetical protein